MQESYGQMHAIYSAANPDQLKSALAEVLEDLYARVAALETQPTDPWGEWTTPPTGGVAALVAAPSEFDDQQRHTEAHADLKAAAIAETKEQIKAAAGEDLEALQAKLRLLTDDGQIPADDGPVAVTSQMEGDTVMVELPPPDPERQESRRRFAERTGMANLYSKTIAPAEFGDHFAIGGPLWLYHYDREIVLQMPVEWRQVFVADIEQDSRKTAFQIGRDILKDAGTGLSAGETMESLGL